MKNILIIKILAINFLIYYHAFIKRDKSSKMTKVPNKIYPISPKTLIGLSSVIIINENIIIIKLSVKKL